MRFTGSAGNARSLDLSQGSPGAYIPSSREDIAFVIGHFRFAPGLCFKARLSAKPLNDMKTRRGPI